jgi:hypothetical protein
LLSSTKKTIGRSLFSFKKGTTLDKYKKWLGNGHPIHFLERGCGTNENR